MQTSSVAELFVILFGKYTYMVTKYVYSSDVNNFTGWAADRSFLWMTEVDLS